MKRIIELAKELSVGINSILTLSGTNGLVIESANSIISPDQEELIKVLLNQDSNTNEDLGIEEIPAEFSIPHEFSAEQIDISNSDNLFQNRGEYLRQFSEKDISTIFTDFEAFTICLGQKDRHSKHIARKYLNYQSATEIDKIEAHEIALASLAKYGSQFISYVIQLPPLPFKAINAMKIFAEIDSQRKLQRFPILRISYKNENGENEKLQLSYFTEHLANGRSRYNNVLVIKNRKTRQEVMKVSRDGRVLPSPNARQIVPVLEAFIRFSSNPKQTLINYGLETGECSRCGRELIDFESLRLGIGPVCRQLYY